MYREANGRLAMARHIEEGVMDQTISRSREGGAVDSEAAASTAKPGLRSRRTRSLIMWSGGLDSTYALARLLRESDDEIFAHHIHLNTLRDDGRGRSRRCEYEAQAISSMLVPMKSEFGAFEYSESRADLSAFSGFGRDTTIAMFFAAQMAMSRRFTPFDRIVFGVNDEDPRWRSGTELYA
ncbi:MAG: hypothetical protein R3174_04715, partial [Gammaproteobacteria bacterium]|nr:hypothetical protein [Gammaproteobacteria bacterium]